jgi:hypothetical protein
MIGPGHISAVLALGAAVLATTALQSTPAEARRADSGVHSKVAKSVFNSRGQFAHHLRAIKTSGNGQYIGRIVCIKAPCPPPRDIDVNKNVNVNVNKNVNVNVNKNINRNVNGTISVYRGSTSVLSGSGYVATGPAYIATGPAYVATGPAPACAPCLWLKTNYDATGEGEWLNRYNLCREWLLHAN